MSDEQAPVKETKQRSVIHKYISNIPSGEYFNPDRPSFEAACGGNRTQGNVLGYLVARACHVAEKQHLENCKVVTISVERDKILKALRISEKTYICCLKAFNGYQYVDSKPYARSELMVNLEAVNEGVKNPPAQKQRGRPRGTGKRGKSCNNKSTENSSTLPEIASTFEENSSTLPPDGSTSDLRQKVELLTSEVKLLQDKVEAISEERKVLQDKVERITTFEKELQLFRKELQLSLSREGTLQAALEAFSQRLEVLEGNKKITEKRESSVYTNVRASAIATAPTHTPSFSSSIEWDTILAPEEPIHIRPCTEPSHRSLVPITYVADMGMSDDLATSLLQAALMDSHVPTDDTCDSGFVSQDTLQAFAEFASRCPISLRSLDENDTHYQQDIHIVDNLEGDDTPTETALPVVPKPFSGPLALPSKQVKGHTDASTAPHRAPTGTPDDTSRVGAQGDREHPGRLLDTTLPTAEPCAVPQDAHPPVLSEASVPPATGQSNAMRDVSGVPQDNTVQSPLSEKEPTNPKLPAVQPTDSEKPHKPARTPRASTKKTVTPEEQARLAEQQSRIAAVYDTLDEFMREVMEDTEAAFLRSKKGNEAILELITSQRVTRDKLLDVCRDMWSEESRNKDSGEKEFWWRKYGHMTVPAICHQYPTRVLSLKGKSQPRQKAEESGATAENHWTRPDGTTDYTAYIRHIAAQPFVATN